MMKVLLRHLPLYVFFLIALVYPLLHVVGRAFIVDGALSLQFFRVMLSSEYYRDVLCNSINIALAVTAISTLVAYPLALVISRYSLPFQSGLHSLILLPLISPPFVGALGIRQVFSRFGSVNVLLLDVGLIDRPLQWLGSGSPFGIILLQSLHLIPILYLSISASLRNAHVSLEEAAVVCGASRWRVLRKVILPLSTPGWFAGATLVFIGSFTDLGTPLIFDYRSVLPVQVYNMLSDVRENPVGYSFVVFTCVLSVSLFFLSRSVMAEGSFGSSTRTLQGRLRKRLSPGMQTAVVVLGWTYALFAIVPQVAVVVVASAKEWFLTVIPSQWTFAHFSSVLAHPMTLHSLLTSLWLSVVASLITVLIGLHTAYIIARSKGRSALSLEVLSIIPLAVPGIVFAFGFVSAYAGTPLDNRINPFPLLLIAYSIRRLPAMVRSSAAGLEEASPTLEEAAIMLGAGPFTVARRIILPLVSRHVVVGAILTFAYSMIEVSDSLLLAMEVRFYPVSKAIYALTGRPDGIELASALGSIVMLVMLFSFYLSEWFSVRLEKRRIVQGVLVLLSLCAAPVAHAQEDELVAVSPHWDGMKEEFGRGFSEKYLADTGRRVRIRWLDLGGTSDIVKYLSSQHRANPAALGIDVMFGGGVDSFLELSREGVLAPGNISREILNRIPESIAGVPLYDAEGRWYTAAISMFGILVNKVAAEKLGMSPPQTWEELARPEYHDLIGIADPRKSGSMHAMFEVILQGYGWSRGWQIIASIAANARSISNHASQVGKDVATGEMIFGIAIDTYAGDIIRLVGGDRVEFIVPKDYVSLNGDAIALLDGAPHPEVGRKFIEFVLSEAGQKLWYYRKGYPGGPITFEMGKLPIIPELYETGEPATVVKGNPFTIPGVQAFDAVTAGRRWNLVNDLFGAFIVEVHDRLVARAQRYPAQPLPSVTLTEDEANTLTGSGSWGSDGVMRSQRLKEWGDGANAKLPSTHGAFYRFRWVPSFLVLMIFAVALARRLKRKTFRG